MIVLPAPTPTPTSTSPALQGMHTLAHLQPRQTNYVGSDCFVRPPCALCDPRRKIGWHGMAWHGMAVMGVVMMRMDTV